jgi:thymidylate synthase (FAD)
MLSPFFVKAPIAVFREWHRHRIGFSYNEESGRYKQLEPEFYIPPPHRPIVQVGKPGHYTFERGTDTQYNLMKTNMYDSFVEAYSTYEAMLEWGIAKEVARGVLPVYIYSSMYVTLNARSLMAFLSLRTKFHNSTFPSFPMWEIEECGHQVDAIFNSHMPYTREAFRKFGSVCP